MDCPVVIGSRPADVGPRVWAPWSTDTLARMPSTRPSFRAANAASTACSWACPQASRFSMRSSTHFTGRPIFLERKARIMASG